MIGSIQGYKSYGVAIGAGLTLALDIAGVLPPGVSGKAYAGLAALGGLTISAKINRAAKAMKS